MSSIPMEEAAASVRFRPLEELLLAAAKHHHREAGGGGGASLLEAARADYWLGKVSSMRHRLYTEGPTTTYIL